jgi:hypothetical protein
MTGALAEETVADWLVCQRARSDRAIKMPVLCTGIFFAKATGRPG